ncbi:hypothetical protein [Geovibrio ferrireducens]|uniref:hypothetical protein n=1 Tax=Geovibrio ferrireducens TaxID=46201 RepID=UPI0022461467|nr:hypothetical protein [Geovibrio ferrireducens]
MSAEEGIRFTATVLVFANKKLIGKVPGSCNASSLPEAKTRMYEKYRAAYQGRGIKITGIRTVE